MSRLQTERKRSRKTIPLQEYTRLLAAERAGVAAEESRRAAEDSSRAVQETQQRAEETPDVVEPKRSWFEQAWGHAP